VDNIARKGFVFGAFLRQYIVFHIFIDIHFAGSEGADSWGDLLNFWNWFSFWLFWLLFWPESDRFLIKNSPPPTFPSVSYHLYSFNWKQLRIVKWSIILVGARCFILRILANLRIDVSLSSKRYYDWFQTHPLYGPIPLLLTQNSLHIYYVKRTTLFNTVKMHAFQWAYW